MLNVAWRELIKREFPEASGEVVGFVESALDPMNRLITMLPNDGPNPSGTVLLLLTYGMVNRRVRPVPRMHEVMSWLCAAGLYQARMAYWKTDDELCFVDVWDADGRPVDVDTGETIDVGRLFVCWTRVSV